MEDLFRQFWWLIFPVAGLLYGLVGMLQQGRTQDRALDVLRTYAEQGKEPPPEVLRALSHHADTDFTGNAWGVGRSGSSGPVASAWWTFFIFIALTAGFGVGMGGFETEAKSAFLTVTIIMGILAFGAFVMAIYATFRRRK